MGVDVRRWALRERDRHVSVAVDGHVFDLVGVRQRTRDSREVDDVWGSESIVISVGVRLREADHGALKPPLLRLEDLMGPSRSRRCLVIVSSLDYQATHQS